MSLRFGYGTNGFANHRLEDALHVIAELGYTGVALTLDHHHLDPFAPDLARRVDVVANLLGRLGLAVVIETGARYLLDPRHKHAPTLLHDEPGKRIDFLQRATAIAADLGAEAMSFWAGVRPSNVDDKTAWERLVRGCAQVALGATVTLGFEPEPGMLVETIAGWERLRAEVDLGLTLDIGHCIVTEPDDVPSCVRRAGPHLVNVQIDDMRAGAHEHLEFGEGEIDFPPVLQALTETGYAGLVAVELPRHSHAAPQVARRSLAFLSGNEWIGGAVERLKKDPAAIEALVAAAGWKAGRANAEQARVRLLRAVDLPEETVTELYHHGDNDEKRAILKVYGMPDLVRDALRSNDSRLIAAALGPAASRLPQADWRQGVLKSVFMGLPLAGVHGLDERADAELGRMLDSWRKEREAAGRTTPGDAVCLLERLL